MEEGKNGSQAQGQAQNIVITITRHPNGNINVHGPMNKLLSLRVMADAMIVVGMMKEKEPPPLIEVPRFKIQTG